MAQEDIHGLAAEQLQLPRERKHFKQLVLGNPNYFGNFPEFGGIVVKPFLGNTAFERLACLGLNPNSALLEGVIEIMQGSGYGTDACGAGSIEYVRFFVEDSSGWHDLGLTSVQVYDIPGSLPLSYAVSVDFSEARKFCGIENIVHVRAILSWEWAPTAGDPNFTPVWGNVVDAEVQVAPKFLFEVPISELIAQKAISIEPDLLKELNINQSLPASPPKPLSFAALKTLYANTKVPAKRFGFDLATKVSSASISQALAQIAPSSGSIYGGSLTAEELSAILAALTETIGDTAYEQLTCAGYNPQTRELEGVIQIRQSSGYSGGLCTHGSTEYVSFYAFFGGAWNALGTAQVQVHDLSAASAANPISYAVFQLSNLTSIPCEELAGVPLRAILSWSTPATSENFIPVWGNVLNTNVQPQISVGTGEGLQLLRIGRVEVAAIDNSTGLAMPYLPVADDCQGNTSPFGGAPSVEGAFSPMNPDSVFNPTTGMVVPGAKPIIYQAWVTPSGGTPYQLINQFYIAISSPTINPPIGTVNYLQTVGLPPGPVLGGAPGAQYYTYYESESQVVDPRVLAVFDASSLAEGNYTIEIQGYAWDGSSQYLAITPAQSKMIHVYNGYPHTEPTEPVLGGPIVNVPEQRPQLFITIDAPSGDCGDVQVGATISGSYSVTDEFFGTLSIALVPITVGGILQPENPVVLTVVSPPGSNPVAYDGSNTDGTSGTFTLDTTGMTPCGYTILMQSWDRALVSDNCWGHYNDEGVGFCLRKAD